MPGKKRSAKKMSLLAFYQQGKHQAEHNELFRDEWEERQFMTAEKNIKFLEMMINFQQKKELIEKKECLNCSEIFDRSEMHLNESLARDDIKQQMQGEKPIETAKPTVPSVARPFLKKGGGRLAVGGVSDSTLFDPKPTQTQHDQASNSMLKQPGLFSKTQRLRKPSSRPETPMELKDGFLVVEKHI